ncbi:MAG: glycerol-3-phosphate acyltransferase [Ignavibacteriales bacterium]|nr:glycerol-3-phosphate acyltransferase [Ignavibacteriales bacterium]
MTPVLVSFVLGYLVGSIPFAYLLTRNVAKVDIRKAGSGNVGGYNAYVVTQSKGMGLLVVVLDCAKGFIAVQASLWLFPSAYLTLGMALLGALAGHNYSFWLGFKGGRGLATAAGGMLLLGPSYVVIWSVVWLTAKKLRYDILASNLVAILVTPPILWVLPWSLVKTWIVVRVESGTFLFFGCILSVVLLLSHFDAVRDIWKDTRSKGPESSSSNT